MKETVTSLPALSLLLALALAGCAPEYGPMGLNGGYSDRELERGVHYIDYRGGAGMGEQDVVAFWRRRAKELCPAGFTIITEKGQPLEAPTTNEVAGRITARGRAKCG